MTSMFKTFAVLGVMAAAAFIAQPAQADRVSFGIGVSVGRRTATRRQFTISPRMCRR